MIFKKQNTELPVRTRRLRKIYESANQSDCTSYQLRMSNGFVVATRRLDYNLKANIKKMVYR